MVSKEGLVIEPLKAKDVQAAYELEIVSFPEVSVYDL